MINVLAQGHNAVTQVRLEPAGPFGLESSILPLFKKAMGILQSPWSILSPRFLKQVAQCAMIAHLVASIMFGDTIIYDAQRQVTLNLKQ